MTMKVDQMFSDWLDQAQPRQVPDQILPQVFAVTSRTRQRRGFVVRMDDQLAAARSLFNIGVSPAVAIALIALLLALFVGAMVGMRLLNSAPPGGWRVLATDVEGGYTWVAGVVTSGNRLIAVGNTTVPMPGACERSTNARVWTSRDGAEWSEHTVPLFADVRVEQVVAAGGRVYVVGQTDASCNPGTPPNFTASSIDGTEWSLVEGTEAFGEAAWVGSLIGLNGAPLALAIESEPEPPDGIGGTRTRIWRVEQGRWVQAGLVEGAQLYGAAANREVALSIGASQDTSGLWRSGDAGTTWTHVELSEVSPMSVVALADGFIAFALRDQVAPETVVLTSDDGASWAERATFSANWGGMFQTPAGLIALSSDPATDECAEWVHAEEAPQILPVPSAGTDPGSFEPARPTGEVCIRYRQVFTTTFSVDGVTWRSATSLPEYGDSPPDITQPIPNSSYGIVATGEGLVVTNPTFSGRLWYVPLDEFLPPVE